MHNPIDMKCFLVVAAVVALALPSPAQVGVSVQVGEPGFYGRIDIGGFPQPQLIYPQPVVIQPAPAGVIPEPIFLHVPPGHAKHWNKHCHKYNACDQPVYFVQDSWYRHQYVPRYREIHGKGHGPHHGKKHEKWHRGKGPRHD